MQPILVTTTCQTIEDAETISKAVLHKRLAGCVQVVGPVSSYYWWKQTIEADSEYQVVMKSERRNFDRLAAEIRSIHPYEVPEIIATEIVAIDAPYRAWLEKELTP